MYGLFIGLGALLLLLTLVVVVKLIWNLRLRNFQKRNGSPSSKQHKLALGSNVASLSLLFIVGVLTLLGGVTIHNKTTPLSLTFKSENIEGISFENAKLIGSENEFQEILDNIYHNSNLMAIDMSFSFKKQDASGETGEFTTVEGEQSSKGKTDTYNQVFGVNEGDVAKISEDASFIVYGPKYSNQLYKIELNSDGSAKGLSQKRIFDEFYFHEMYLYQDKIILIGMSPISIDAPNNRIMDSQRYFYSYRLNSAYYILNAETFEVIKKEVFNGRISETRMIDNMLYVVASNYLSKYYNKDTEIPSFENIYYFKGDSNIFEVTKIISINLDTENLAHQEISFFGSNLSFYMGNGLIVLLNYKWRLTHEINKPYNTSTVIAISYDSDGTMKYVGSSEVEGYALNQYFIDVYQDTIRVVTTFGQNNRNSLYIFEIDSKSDNLNLVGLLNKGIGKPNEQVKSVTYQENMVKIVTFLRTDPLYTIDVSDPKNPVITSAIEEPGFSSVLIIWDDEGNTVGIGYMANEGIRTGIKVSAYATNDPEPTQTIEFPYYNEDNEYNGHLTAPALENPRQNLLLNKEANLFGFITNGFKVENYESKARVLMFTVNFSNKEAPLVIHEIANSWITDNIEKMVMVDSVLHILSPQGVISYNFYNNSFYEMMLFDKDIVIPIT